MCLLPIPTGQRANGIQTPCPDHVAGQLAVSKSDEICSPEPEPMTLKEALERFEVEIGNAVSDRGLAEATEWFEFEEAAGYSHVWLCSINRAATSPFAGDENDWCGVLGIRGSREACVYLRNNFNGLANVALLPNGDRASIVSWISGILRDEGWGFPQFGGATFHVSDDERFTRDDLFRLVAEAWERLHGNNRDDPADESALAEWFDARI